MSWGRSSQTHRLGSRRRDSTWGQYCCLMGRCERCRRGLRRHRTWRLIRWCFIPPTPPFARRRCRSFLYQVPSNSISSRSFRPTAVVTGCFYKVNIYLYYYLYYVLFVLCIYIFLLDVFIYFSDTIQITKMYIC